ncbi:MAG: sodium/proton-translocating pyrophosphatase [Myxococcales bacterium]|nr:sodium/proton-translocating pyrophosphatase [Myxococcales bacterium]
MDSQTLLLLAPIAGVIALAYAFVTAGWIGKQDAGNTEMKTIASKIQEGAMAFLGAEYRVLGLFVLVVAGVLVGLNVSTGKGSPLIGVAFVVGALCSALAGFAGMRVATQANVRTAAAARTGLSPALTVAFRGGAVMGMSVVGLALLGLGLMVPSSTSGPGELPVLSEIDRDDVQRIEISLGQLDKMVITGSMDAGWTIVAPFEAEADDLMVRSLLKVFQDPVRMDVKVDEGEEALETYLVDDQNGALVELFGAGEAPLVSVVIGGDMPGGHSFVRLPGSQVVYRARVGSRGRVDRDFSEWRDKMVVQDNPEEVRWIALTRGGETLRFLRAELGPPGPDGTPNLGPWVYLEDPEFPVD